MRDVDNGDQIGLGVGAGPKMSWTSAYILMVSRMVGSGIFAMPGVIIQSTGTVDLAFWVWILGAIIAAIAAVPYLELSCMLPRNGGDSLYLEFAFPRPRYLVSTILAARSLFQALTANNCVVFGNYLAFALGRDESSRVATVSSFILLFGVALMHGIFPRQGILVQDFFGWFKIVALCILSMAAVFAISVHPRSSSSADTLPKEDPIVISSLGWSTISLVLFRVQYAYSGTANVNNVLGEVVDPVGLVRRIVPLCLASACALYLLLNWALVTVLPLPEIMRTGELAMGVFLNRFLGANAGNAMLPLFACMVVAGNVMVSVYSEARLNQEIARRGHFPQIFASSSPWNTPLGGVILNVVPAALIILIIPGDDAFSFLVDVEGYAAQFVALAIAGAVLYLRWRQPLFPRPFRSWKFILYGRVATCGLLIISPFMPTEKYTGHFGLWQGMYALIGVSVIFGAVLYWFCWARVVPEIYQLDLVEFEVDLPDGSTATEIIGVPRQDDAATTLFDGSRSRRLS